MLSFLKETRGIQTWTEKDLAKALNIGLPQAKEAMAALQLQGYIEPTGHTAKWRVTEQGDLVSGAKPPRFTRQSVEDALAVLRDRIKAVNEDRDAPYRITEGVAIGDFLSDRARVQAAEVGIRLLPRAEGESIASAADGCGASLKDRVAAPNKHRKSGNGKTGRMIGRNAAVAEIGAHRQELTGPLAFAAWLGVHAVLLTTARAKIEAFLEWAWDYFGSAHVDPVLDRPDQMNIDWNAEEKQEQSPAKEQAAASS